MSQKILLGYELGSGEPVEAKLHHLFISGVTQHSGKTTGLEAFIDRARLPALVFRTGRGELGFTKAHKILPYFRERTDWRFLEGLLSVHLREKTKIYRSNLMTVSRGASDLQTVWNRIRQRLTGRSRARGWDLKMFTEIDQYFSEFMPSLGQVKFATELRLENGLNVVDLEGQPVALQQLVIAASLEYIMEKMSGVIVVVPEAYKLIPIDRPSPVRLAAEAITREGMKIKNFLWLDSQQLTGLDLDILRNVDIWLFGRQTLDREKERAAKMIPGHGVNTDDIHGLTLGQFYVVQYGEKVQKLYVQPAWMETDLAVEIAKGEVGVPLPPQVTAAASIREALKDDPHSLDALITHPEILEGIKNKATPMSALEQELFRRVKNVEEHIAQSDANNAEHNISIESKLNQLLNQGPFFHQVPAGQNIILHEQETRILIDHKEPVDETMTTKNGLGQVLYVIVNDLEGKPVRISQIGAALREHGWSDNERTIRLRLMDLENKHLVVKEGSTSDTTYRPPSRVKIVVANGS